MKLTISIPDREATALKRLASMQLREVDAQAAWLIRQQLAQLNMLRLPPLPESVRREVENAAAE